MSNKKKVIVIGGGLGGLSAAISLQQKGYNVDLYEQNKIVYLNVNDVQINIWKQLIYHKNKWLSNSLKRFIEYVKKTEFDN